MDSVNWDRIPRDIRDSDVECQKLFPGFGWPYVRVLHLKNEPDRRRSRLHTIGLARQYDFRRRKVPQGWENLVTIDQDIAAARAEVEGL